MFVSCSFFLIFSVFFQKHTSISSEIKSQTTASGEKGFSVVSYLFICLFIHYNNTIVDTRRDDNHSSTSLLRGHTCHYMTTEMQSRIS